MRGLPGLVIRSETAGDDAGIRQVNQAAFGTSEEADLVDALRADGDMLISTVAELDERIVGHVLFSRMAIDTVEALIPAVALAPMAVAPPHQRQGIGGRLIANGLETLRARGERVVIVVGHPTYYPRFGFSSVRGRALEHPFAPDAFMVLELAPGALDGTRGRVKYPPAFRL
jgi:putative acetyltransferase